MNTQYSEYNKVQKSFHCHLINYVCNQLVLYIYINSAITTIAKDIINHNANLCSQYILYKIQNDAR